MGPADYTPQSDLPVSVEAGTGRDIIGVHTPRIPYPGIEELLEDRLDAPTARYGPVDLVQVSDESQRPLRG